MALWLVRRATADDSAVDDARIGIDSKVNERGDMRRSGIPSAL